jgi:sterol desaturase/sphingolipid hydroxylase (fatty acid hydroxylase superfamily)
MWDLFKPILVDFQNPVIFAIPFFLLLIGIEVYLNYKERKNNYILKDSLASISMGLGSIVSDIIAKSIAFIGFVWLFEHYGFFKEQLSWTVLGWVLLFFLDDFTFYWHHRLSHEFRILWAAHVNHHSSEQYNLSTALRQSWTEILYKYIFFLWLPFLGFHPMMVLTQISINLIFQFWVHTKLIKKLPPFIEFLFNTPEPVVYGITTNIDTYNPLKIATHEYASLWRDIREAPRFSDKLKYIFYAPGWSHNGKTLTARQMRDALKQK